LYDNVLIISVWRHLRWTDTRWIRAQNYQIYFDWHWKRM